MSDDENYDVNDDLESFLDEDLVNLTREGNQDAYAVLWTRYYSLGMNYALGITRKDPEDLVVEAYTKILRAIRGGGGPKESFRLYLYQAIRNAAITGGKKTNDVVPGLEEIGSGTASVEGDVLSHIDTERIKHVLLSMKPEQRTILWLSEVEELSTNEIASQMGITKTNVSTSAQRARQEFVRLWTQDHVRLNGVKANSEHAYVLGHAGEYLAGKPSNRVRTRVEAHLATCEECTDKLAEAKSVASLFRSRLAPVVAGAAASVVMAGDKAFAAETPPMPGRVKAAFRGPKTRALVGAAAGVALVVGLVGLVATTSMAPEKLPVAASTPAAVAPAGPEEPAATPAPVAPVPPSTPTPAPTASPSPVPDPVADQGSPVVAPVKPAAPAVTAKPRPKSEAAKPAAKPAKAVKPAITIVSVNTGPGGVCYPVVTGTAKPGSTIQVSNGNGPAAAVRVNAAGEWTSPMLNGYIPGRHGVVAYRADESQTSASGVVDISLLPQIATTVRSGVFTVTVSKAVPGVAVELSIDGQAGVSVIPDRDGQGSYTAPYASGAFQKIVFRYHPVGCVGPSFVMKTGL